MIYYFVFETCIDLEHYLSCNTGEVLSIDPGVVCCRSRLKKDTCSNRPHPFRLVSLCLTALIVFLAIIYVNNIELMFYSLPSFVC